MIVGRDSTARGYGEKELGDCSLESEAADFPLKSKIPSDTVITGHPCPVHLSGGGVVYCSYLVNLCHFVHVLSFVVVLFCFVCFYFDNCFCLLFLSITFIIL